MNPSRVVMVAFRGMQPLDFIGPYDVFHAAGIETVVAGEHPGTQVDERLSIVCDVGLDVAPSATALFGPAAKAT